MEECLNNLTILQKFSGIYFVSSTICLVNLKMVDWLYLILFVHWSMAGCLFSIEVMDDISCSPITTNKTDMITAAITPPSSSSSSSF